MQIHNHVLFFRKNVILEKKNQELFEGANTAYKEGAKELALSL